MSENYETGTFSLQNINCKNNKLQKHIIIFRFYEKYIKYYVFLIDELNNGYPPNGGGPSTAIQGENRNSIIYRDEAGYEYHTNWEVRGTR